MRPEAMRLRHRSLVVASCEWRAYGVADPEVLADRVFDRIDPLPEVNLHQLYRAIQQVCFDAYQRHTDGRSIMEHLRGGLLTIAPRAAADPLLNELSLLRGSDRLLLQTRYWDDLDPAEAAEALRLDPVKLAERQERAEARFLARARKHRPDLIAGDVADIVRSLKTGEHSRHPD